MTAQGTGLAATLRIAAFADAVRSAFGLGLKMLLGVTLVLAAGLLAVLTAIAGLLIAGLAILMRAFGGEAQIVTVRTRPAGAEPADTITLEARRTARGWTVE